MLIIVEGPPGAGKTSLVNKLRTALAHQYGKEKVTTLYGNERTKITTDNRRYLDAFLSRLESYHPSSGDHIICDEWHWGYAAMKNTFNSTEQIQPYSTRYVNLKLAQIGAVIVHLNPASEVLRQRLDRKNPFLKPSSRIHHRMVDIRQSFIKLSHDSDVTVLPSNSSLSTIVDTAKHLESRAAKFNEWSHTAWPFYLGSTTPKGVLIDLDPKKYETLYPTPNSGESFIHRGLFSLTPEQRESFGLLNVAHVTSESFIALMKSLKAPRLLALGREASLFLGEVAHSVVPSPRSTRRTFGKHAQEYGAMLHTTLSMPTGTDMTKWSPMC